MADLLLIENFLDDATCQRVLSDLRSGQDSPAPVYGVRPAAGVEQGIRRVSRVAVSEQVLDDVDQRLDACTKRLSEHFGVTADLVRDDTHFRKISLIVFLNRLMRGAGAGNVWRRAHSCFTHLFLTTMFGIRSRARRALCSPFIPRSRMR
jgi:hypothetical protein